MIPIIWILLSSFKTRLQLFSPKPLWFFKPTLDNYRYIFTQASFLAAFRNSIIVTTITNLLSLVLGLMAAYALARYRFRSRILVSYFIIATRLMPAFALVIPAYLIFSALGLVNSLFGLIIAYITFSLPFSIWMLRGFIQTLPTDVEESARIDGCNLPQIIFLIIAPMAMPGIASTGLLVAIGAWCEFLWALILSTSISTQTLPVLITGFQAAMGIEWGPMTAAASIVLLPVIFLTLFGQRFLISGLTAGAIK